MNVLTNIREPSNILNLVLIKKQVNDCHQRIEAGLIESAGELLQKIFQTAADTTLEKKSNKNNSKKVKRNPKKWFDKDCIRLKSLANKAANLKHNQPWNNNS